MRMCKSMKHLSATYLAKGKGTGYYWSIHRPGGETVPIWIPNRQHKMWMHY